MAAAKPVYVVGSIGEALELANNFQDVVGYMVAPLQVLSGGNRKWHGLDPEDRTRWMPDKEPSDTKEAKVPHPDEGSESLPPLPPSRVNIWELAFMDCEGRFLRPYVRIQERRPAPEAEVPSPAPDPAQAGGGAQLGEQTLLTLIKEQHRFSMDCLKANKDILATVSEHQKRLTEQLQAELEKANVRAAKSEEVRDMALGANTELHHKMAELESDNLIATTIQKVFEGKPELLVAAGKDLLAGAVNAIKNAS